MDLESRGAYRWVSVASPLFLLAVWEAASRLGLVNMLFLPPPSLIGRVLFESLVKGTLATDVLVSLKRIVLGFLLGALLGLLVTLGMVMRRDLNLVLDSAITLLYPLPKVAILPLLLIWLGAGDLTRIVVIATGSLFPVAINTYAAVQNIDPVLIRAARNLGASDRQIVRHVILPGTLPAFYTGAVLGAGLCLILLVYAEMTAADSGVGHFTYTAATLFETEKAFAGVFTLGTLGWAWHRLITLIEARHCPWRRTLR